MIQDKIDQYSDMLFKIAYLRLKSVQDAEDVVQEVFYQYLKKTDGFSDEEHEKAWLIRVTLNACRKVWRSAWNRHRSDEDVVLYENFADGNSQPGPEENLVAMDERRMLLEAVGTLPAKYRDVIHLFYYEEMSVKEIAEATGRKDSTVTSQLTRGRELLRKKLKEEYDFA
ncbi:MAG: sigma-70 family RNA polymerase sigma factor [Lachnospiraceae bacterium]|nr:sigma-70 family RNA polymerase sigma factor [Lachnospiraceae bacterium]